MSSAQRSIAIVGAGPAGLATAACLRRFERNAVIYEAGDVPGATWANLYDRLQLHTVKAFSGLPGWPMPHAFPRYPSRQQVADYLAAYAAHFALDIKTGCPVERATRDGDGWRIATSQGEQHADVLVAATGVFANPVRASYPNENAFQGRVMHSSLYKNGAPFAGQRVLVVGAGNSGAEIAVDLVEGGATVTSSIRAGTNVVPRDLLGVPIQRWAHLIARMPRGVTRAVAPVLLRRSARRQARAGVPRPAQGALDRPGIPIIGLEFLHHTQQGDIAIAEAIDRFTPTGVRFADGHEAAFDTVIFATGYRPALGFLDGAIALDERGHPRLNDIRSLDAPNLYLVGFTYDIRGTLFNIARESLLAALLISQSAG